MQTIARISDLYTNILFMYGIARDIFSIIVCLCYYTLLMWNKKKERVTVVSDAGEKRFRAQTLDFRGSSVFSMISQVAFNYARNLPAEVEYNLPCLAFRYPSRSIILSPLALVTCLPCLLSPLFIYIYLRHFPWFCLLHVLRYCHFPLLPSACTRRVSRDRQSISLFSVHRDAPSQSCERGDLGLRNTKISLLLSFRLEKTSYPLGFASDKALNFRITIACFLHPIPSYSSACTRIW